MDQGEILVQFMSVTGTDFEFAQSFLETNGWDLDLCVNLYLESGGNIQAPQPTAQGIPTNEHFDIPSDAMQYAEPEIRAPIMPKQEILVEEDPYLAHVRRRQQQRGGFHNSTPKGVFEMFRDLKDESKAPKRTDLPETESQKKLKTLADLFRPPIELIEPGSFEDVKQKSLARHKWMLVNIQTITEFDCQRLNRDTWSDAGLRSIISEHFVLWQVLRESEEGARYCRFYPVNVLPHIAIIDSRTGERVVVLEGFIDASGLKTELCKFTDAHSFDETETPKAPIVQPIQKRKGDLSEEEQLLAAIAASLGPGDYHQQPYQPYHTYHPHQPAAAEVTQEGSEVQVPPVHHHFHYPPALSPTAEPDAVFAPMSPPVPTMDVSATPSDEIDSSIKDNHSNPSAENTCTIQIRLPDGPIKGHFRPTDTVDLVHKYTALHLPRGTFFTLISTFPKRSFTGDLLNETLEDVDLVPRAALNCEIHSG